MSVIIQQWLREDIDQDSYNTQHLVDLIDIATLTGTSKETVKRWRLHYYPELFPAPVCTGWQGHKRGMAKKLYDVNEILGLTRKIEADRVQQADEQQQADELRKQLAEVEAQMRVLDIKAAELRERLARLNEAS
ncbi:hypothetical protein [Streptomyces sp. NBC_00470]|uniref:hypothetical protein n=1 Tax=Streptomyces sp. NBC_00470 TaxID=2975753 RepID=UPI0030E46E1D